MKTLTEFSTLTLRKAAAARSAARSGRTVTAGELAQAASDDAAAKAEAAKAEAEGGDDTAAPEGDAPAEAAADAPAEAAAESTEAPAAEAKPAEPDPAIGAVAEALGLQPERAARLLEALYVVGGSIDQVRLVRVFQGEKGPHGAVTRGEFHYVVDRVARKGRGGDRRDDRGGDRGGRGGREGRGGDRGGRGGG